MGAMQQLLWGIAAVLLGLAVASGYAEHRRRKRVDMDKVGVVPWPLVQFLALMGALMAASVAFNLG
jgi:hypothetical protein